MKERLESIKNKDYVPNDILSAILDNWKSDNIDIEMLIDDFVTFFIAGQETTAKALAFCFYEMGRNRDIFNNARQEVDRILGDKSEVTYQDASDLKYCSAIFKESLRMYPPVANLLRVTTKEMNINGLKIYPDTIMTVKIYI